MDYFLARYLLGASMRFTTPDPENAGADPLNPQSWNAYAYVLNNPLLGIDPSGRVTVTENQLEVYGFGLVRWWDSPCRIEGVAGACNIVASVLQFGAGVVVPLVKIASDLRVDATGAFEQWLGPTQVTVAIDGVSYLGPVSPGYWAPVSTAAVLGALPVIAAGGADVLAGWAASRLIADAYAGSRADQLVFEQAHAQNLILLAAGGGRTGRKVNEDRAAAAQAEIARIMAELNGPHGNPKPNKTPQDKKRIEALKRALKRAIDRLRKSEEHARTGQGPQ